MRVARLGTVLAVAGATVAVYNRCTVGQLCSGRTTSEPVTVCVPARNEAQRLPELIGDLRAQTGVAALRVLILDDNSTDDTYAAAVAAIDGDTRFALHRSEADPAPGWTGKSAACSTLADLAESSQGADAGTIVFLDADVRLEPGALAAAVDESKRSGVALLTAWPRQDALTPTERLIQPLLCWSWASTLPIVPSQRSLRPSMAVACGQFLVFDAASYRAVGGHSAVAASVTEDLDLARVIRRAGMRTSVVGAGSLARCRMYRTSADLEQGYERWLWTAYGSVAGTAAVGVYAVLAYLIPPLAAVVGSERRWGLIGYAAAVAGRVAARSTESGGSTTTTLPDALLHPVSVLLFLRLTWRSHRSRRRGTLAWKGRALNVGDSET